MPALIVQPLDEDDLAVVLRYASANAIPISIPRWWPW
jgi:FAD/FMN-containing dehydrogenase